MFFFKPTPPTDIYTLSLHDALPISRETWRNTGTVGSSRKPRGRRRPHAHEACDDRGGVRRRETNVCRRDRKSTRLNSSHLGISYAVFCLKKKTRHTTLRK